VQTFIEGVKRSLAEHHDPLSWRRVTMPGLDIAWVGVNVPAIDTGGRPWVWEIVTPEQYDASSRLQDDPMVLAVHHDTVITEVRHLEHAGSVVRMQVPVRHAPEAITVANELTADSPWSLRMEVGWTIQALGEAAQCWIDREAPGTTRLKTPQFNSSKAHTYKLHPAIDIESAAFDLLLTLDPNDAAVVTSLLARVHEALQPYR